MLNIADIQINGDRPWDIQVRNQKFYQRILAGGSLALGESYMDGWWDCEALDQFFAKIMQARLDQKVKHSPRAPWAIFKAKMANPQRRSKAYDQRFFRMWAYYLLSCAGSFRARRNQLWQIVFSKKGLNGGYQSIRE